MDFNKIYDTIYCDTNAKLVISRIPGRSDNQLIALLFRKNVPLNKK